MKQIRMTAAIAIAFRGEGAEREVLMTQRWAPEHPHSHLKWQLPGGGQEFGETIQETLLREAQEELLLSAKILSEYSIVKDTLYIAPNKDEYHITLVGFVVQLPANQDPDISGDPETHAWEWVKISDVKNRECLKHTKEFVEEGIELV